MSLNDKFLVALLIAVVAFVWHCPIFKPWFGFRKPKGARGKWGQ